MPSAKAPAKKMPMAVSSRIRWPRLTTAMATEVIGPGDHRPGEDRAAGDVGEHDAGEDGVAERVADEGQAAEDDVGADGAAGRAHQHRLDQRALEELERKRIGQPAHRSALVPVCVVAAAVDVRVRRRRS